MTFHFSHSAPPSEPLAADAILAAVVPERRALLRKLEILPEVDSTNRYLLEQPAGPGFHACFAEFQSAGRGRAGKRWLSPYGAGVWLSVQTRCAHLPPALNQRLALVVAALLRDLGAPEGGLKWPNDVIWRGTQKLAGLLSEARVHHDIHLVCGVGLNVTLPPHAAPPPEQPWCDLTQVLGPRCPPRNQVAGLLLDAFLTVLSTAVENEPLVARWNTFDILYNTPITLLTARGPLSGIARGINGDGALLVDDGGQIRRYVDGEVSVRK